MGKFLGIVMTPLDVQVEGLNAVMDRIQSTGATAINCGRTLNREATAETGFRAPPLDIDGYDLFELLLAGRGGLTICALREIEHTDAVLPRFG